jgi:3-oxoacyl-[acyl-carrier-protein] synthase-1
VRFQQLVIHGAECIASLESEQAGMGEMEFLHSKHAGALPVAEVKLSNEAMAQRLGLTKVISRTAMLSMMAAKEALDNAAIPDLNELSTGFISANTVGGMDKTENFFKDFIADPSKGKLREVVHHECGYITELAADYLGIRHIYPLLVRLALPPLIQFFMAPGLSGIISGCGSCRRNGCTYKIYT